MARKILRDLEKNKSQAVYLRDEDLKKAIPTNKKNFVDLSQIGKEKFVITTVKRRLVRDVTKKVNRDDVNEEQKNEQVFFFEIGGEKTRQIDRLGEIIRLAATGTLILFVMNLINVYQRGVVVKDNVIASAASGYEHLLEAGKQAKSADFKNAEGTFDDASKNFDAAMNTLNFLRGHQDSFFTKEKTVESVNGLLDAAKNLAQAGKDFSRGIENIKQLPELFLQENGQNIFSITTTDSIKKSLTEKLKEDLTFVDKATQEVKLAQQNLAKVSADVLPDNIRNNLGIIKQKVDELLEILNTTQEKIPAILHLLGDRYPHRYLILLQNDTEARPTGGFIGSYILVDINDGYITKMDFRDVYETDGQLQEEIPAPEDIAKITKNWRMRDSNYSPDFAISAEKAAWFLQKEKGPSVDTVIAINQSVLADLLAITGPIKLASLPTPLDKDNYQIVLSYIIESKLSGKESPKKVLGEFIEAFKEKLFTSETGKNVLIALIKACEQKKILMYSRDTSIQKMFDQLGMSGRVIRTKENEDYLSVIVTSIGGNKSDAYVKQNLYHNTLIDQSGMVTDELTIVRKHTWTPQEIERWENILLPFDFEEIPEGIQTILGKGENKANIKVYVPQGSKLLDAYGIEKENVFTRNDEGTGKTYFLFEMDVKPGEEGKVTISYELPESLTMYPADTYKFFSQTQPAIRGEQLEKNIYVKPGLQILRQFPEALKKNEEGKLSYAAPFTQDIYLSALIGS